MNILRKVILIILLADKSFCIMNEQTEPVNFGGKFHNGYITLDDETHLHFSFIQSETDATNDPIILFWNSGRGCSNLRYLYTYIGPHFIQGSKLETNPYRWTRSASILSIDSPTEAGYSLSTSNASMPYKSDDQSSLLIQRAVYEILNVNPLLKDNDIYLAGTGLAGRFIFTLAYTLLSNMTHPLNVKGIILGNADLNWSKSFFIKLEFMYHHGLIDEREWETVVETCCGGTITNCDAYFVSQDSYELCEKIYDDISMAPWTSNINLFNFHSPCVNDSMPSDNILPCIDESPYVNFFNNDATLNAMNVDPKIREWKLCRPVSIIENPADSSAYVKYLVQKGLRMLFYNGDLDIASNFLSTQQFVVDLNYNVTVPTRLVLIEGKVIGTYTAYENVEYVTILGAGHAAYDKQREALYFVQRFLENKIP